MESGRDIAQLDRVGGDLAVDFVNTLGGALAGPWDDEWLIGYEHLVAWARHAGALPGSAADALLRAATGDPRGASAAHGEAIALREALYRVLAATVRGDDPPEEDLAAVLGAHLAALAEARPAFEGPRLDWAWDGADDLRRPLWPVVQAAVDLLRSDRLARLKQCRNCRWLFLDASRNCSRRWCSMEHCGTAAKVRATRARRHASRA